MVAGSLEKLGWECQRNEENVLSFAEIERIL